MHLLYIEYNWLPITVTSTERSFSKLKLLKSYLLSTMSQERLNELDILYIVHDLLENIKYKSLKCDFTAQTMCRIIFQWFFIIIFCIFLGLIIPQVSHDAECVIVAHQQVFSRTITTTKEAW